MADKTPQPIPCVLNIAPRGKTWKNWKLVNGTDGFPTRESMEKYLCNPERVRSLETEREMLQNASAQLERLHDKQKAKIDELEAELESLRQGQCLMQIAEPAAPQAVQQVQAFQARVGDWLMECFDHEIAHDGMERNHRFLEEALELVQSHGCTASEAHQLVDYVFGRPVGEPVQELGGAMVTLAALCFAHDLDMAACAETELARICDPATMAKIKAKQAAKPRHSPLPQLAAPHPTPQGLDAQQLHSDIMNLPCVRAVAGRSAVARIAADVYKQGFRDARHAAAELVLAAQAKQGEQS